MAKRLVEGMRVTIDAVCYDKGETGTIVSLESNGTIIVKPDKPHTIRFGKERILIDYDRFEKDALIPLTDEKNVPRETMTVTEQTLVLDEEGKLVLDASELPL